MRRTLRTAATGTVVAGLAVTLLAVGTAVGSPPGEADGAPGATAAGVVVPAAPPDPLQALQQRLQRRPGDSRGWAQLGLAHVQQARLTADPSGYGRAEQACARSLQIQPKDNPDALTGQAGLAAARHDFAGALRLAEASLAVNAYSPTTYGVRTEALVELGRYDQALTSVQRMLDLDPDVAALTRASYVAELRGQVDQARSLLERAAESAFSGADKAYAFHYLVELAWNTGDVPAAREAIAAALQADPAHLPSLAGRAKVLAATGDRTAALADYRNVVEQLP